MPTVLNQGDLVFTGYDGAGVDGFQFITTVALEAGTQITFTDGELLNDIDGNGTNGFSADSGDDFLVWTVGDAIDQFSVVTIFASDTSGNNPMVTINLDGSPAPDTFDQGSFSSADPNGSPVVPGINTDSDAVWAFQGSTFDPDLPGVMPDKIVTFIATGSLADATDIPESELTNETGLVLFDPNDPDAIPTALVLEGDASFAEFDVNLDDAGGEDTDNNGTIDLITASGADGLRQLIYNPANFATDQGNTGDVNGLDPDAPFDAGSVSFTCFVRGTLIDTPEGPTPIEQIHVGDYVTTRDNGIQAVRWVGQRLLDARSLSRNPHLRPIRISAGAMGDGLPKRDLHVSPQHRMALTGWRLELLFGGIEALAPAKGLINDRSIMVDQTAVEVEYFHLLFDSHEIITAEGALTESFHPGETALSSLDREARDELFEIFPNLRKMSDAYGPTALPVLRPFEAGLISRHMH